MHSATPDELIARLTPALRALRDRALALEARYADELAQVEPGAAPSARNLLHYLAVRQQDIRGLQRDLAALGLSSLGILEAHALASLNAVIGLLERLGADGTDAAPTPPVDFASGPRLLREHTRALLGPQPSERNVRIMVTMPSAAARDPDLVEALLAAGMDVMRINCAHDGPEAWAAMAAHLRRAEQRLGRSCRIQADLAGPKLRTGPIAPLGRFLRARPARNAMGGVVAPARVWLTPREDPTPVPAPLRHGLPLPGELLHRAAVGDVLEFTDPFGRRRGLRITELHGASRTAESNRSIVLAEGALMDLVREGTVIASCEAVDLPEVVEPILLRPGEVLELTRREVAGEPAQRDAERGVLRPAHIHCTLEAAFARARPGERVWLDDGKIGGRVLYNDGECLGVEITHAPVAGAKLRAEKGINLPDTALGLAALTDKDLEDLAEIVKFADMVALSFLRGPQDVLQLEEQLHRLGAGHLGIVLKIENRAAFMNLPRILLASLRSPPVGVMVARGDLAVELGFERLSEVQEEILWLCEAAHVPVIWATQVLEGLAKRGAPSRAEVSDAAMSSRAECVMLNKGPHIVETVQFLSGLLARMDTHHYKRMALLRRLSVSEL